jgi:transposase
MPKYRQFAAAFKAKVALDIISGQKSAADICRERSLKSELVSKWKSQFLANAAKVFERQDQADPQEARIDRPGTQGENYERRPVYRMPAVLSDR